jgi:hypothetical protein
VGWLAGVADADRFGVRAKACQVAACVDARGFETGFCQHGERRIHRIALGDAAEVDAQRLGESNPVGLELDGLPDCHDLIRRIWMARKMARFAQQRRNRGIEQTVAAGG